MMWDNSNVHKMASLNHSLLSLVLVKIQWAKWQRNELLHWGSPLKTKFISVMDLTSKVKGELFQLKKLWLDVAEVSHLYIYFARRRVEGLCIGTCLEGKGLVLLEIKIFFFFFTQSHFRHNEVASIRSYCYPPTLSPSFPIYGLPICFDNHGKNPPCISRIQVNQSICFLSYFLTCMFPGQGKGIKIKCSHTCINQCILPAISRICQQIFKLLGDFNIHASI